jgi:putative endonuclease
MRKRTTRQLGIEGENKACQYLETQGYVVQERNFRTRTGEIDLIMLDGDTLVFVEVKARTSLRYGYGSEAITTTKQRIIRQVALEYLQQRGKGTYIPVRFDAVILTYAKTGEPEILHIPSAF